MGLRWPPEPETEPVDTDTDGGGAPAGPHDGRDHDDRGRGRDHDVPGYEGEACECAGLTFAVTVSQPCPCHDDT